MNLDTLYHERMLSTPTFLVLLAGGIILLYIPVVRLLSCCALQDLGITLLLLALGIVTLALAINLARLSIKMDPGSLSVGFGLMRARVLWENVEGCERDTATAIRYGGFGLRITRVGHKWRLGFIVIGKPRVRLSLRAGRFREIGFSTDYPDKVIELVRQNAGLGP